MSILRQFAVVVFAAARMGAQTTTSDGGITGKEAFSACAACHGLDGKGGEHAPNIATEATVQRMTDNDLMAVIRNGIPAAGMPGFSKLLDDGQIHGVVKYLRSLNGGGDAVNLPGDAEKGRKIFFGSAKCGECHMVNGQGQFLGADLSGYGGGHSAADIRQWILRPDENQNPRRGTVTVVTQAGTKYRGIVRNEDNFSLQMQTPDGNFHLFDKSALVSVDHESKSMMPSDYGSKLTKAEVYDLVKFLTQGGNRGSSKTDDDRNKC